MSLRRMASCSGASMPILTRRPVPPSSRDLNGAVGEQLRHGRVGVHTFSRLDDDGFVGAAAEHQHTIKPSPARAAPWRESFLEGRR